MTNISFSQVQKSFHKNKILAIPDFHHLLSSHDKTDHTLSTHFGFLGGYKYRALVLLRPRFSRGKLGEFETII